MSADPVVTNYENEMQEFERLCAQVLRGRHLPTSPELLQGVPFFKDDIKLDVDAFARHFLIMLNRENDADVRLSLAMARLTASHEKEDFRSAALAFLDFGLRPKVTIVGPEEMVGRCWFYAAIAGDLEATKLVAQAAIDTRVRIAHVEAAVRQLKGLLAWALAAAGLVAPPNSWTRETANNFLRHGAVLGECFGELVERTIERRAATRTGTDETVAPGPEDDAIEDQSAEADDQPHGAIVFTAIGNLDTSEGKRVGPSLKPLVGKLMRLVTVPDLEPARSTLVSEFPHAIPAVDAMIDPLLAMSTVAIRPAILVGPPGCGKTTFAIRLADVLGLPLELFPCGGVSDSALAGTPRRWSSGEPSLPVQVIQSTETANPLIVLDEIEKASTSRHNGALLDCLLGLWEQRTARAWRDPYIEAPVDLSHVNWLATANDIERVPDLFVTAAE